MRIRRVAKYCHNSLGFTLTADSFLFDFTQRIAAVVGVGGAHVPVQQCFLATHSLCHSGNKRHVRVGGRVPRSEVIRDSENSDMCCNSMWRGVLEDFFVVCTTNSPDEILAIRPAPSWVYCEIVAQSILPPFPTRFPGAGDVFPGPYRPPSGSAYRRYRPRPTGRRGAGPKSILFIFARAGR